MNSNPVGWFEIYVEDMPRAQAFYESVLKVTLENLEDPSADKSQSAFSMQAFPSDMSHYGASGALVHMEGAPVGKNSTLVYFSCDDCAVEAGRVTAAGGVLEREKMAIGEYGFIALATDTEGNMIGFHSQQ
ncbi:VOC family protein [Alteromonas sp. 1_MG-2023]|uniref:VOC family protein n=1 Tax=Alteromonas sp. 1_MG-2023 TaxID=3062669 RepID=UPI0026E32FA9|nr:VOC family protein [Alteromonas sp. 1_MG-2023]MDO6568697.1 VOC family protein [Alteromonas sp. 1_MG-2023]